MPEHLFPFFSSSTKLQLLIKQSCGLQLSGLFAAGAVQTPKHQSQMAKSAQLLPIDYLSHLWGSVAVAFSLWGPVYNQEL